MLSQGVPMIRSGDEIGHTQLGNNNPYCLDNEINWLDWRLDDGQRGLLDFVCRAIRLRRGQPVLGRRQFFQGRQLRGAASDITWMTPAGEEMQDCDWHAKSARVLGVQLNGHMIDELDEHGRPIVGATLLVLFNAEDREIRFTLPKLPRHEYWRPILDTGRDRGQSRRLPGGVRYQLLSHSMAAFVLKRVRPKFLARFVRSTAKAARPAAERSGAPARSPAPA
jgi:glycogen operon protein